MLRFADRYLVVTSDARIQLQLNLTRGAVSNEASTLVRVLAEH